MTVASMATGLALGQVEYYDATAHAALRFALRAGCVVALGSMAVLFADTVRARRRRRDV